jgi:predicted HicB family RNase H-like nuclease
MAEHFTYRVSWSEEDGEHVGTCLEFPSLSHLADDPEAALRGVRKLVTDVVTDLRANNEPIPQPLADTPYSGKFITRIPPELHRQLALEAAQEQISLNRLVSMRLSAQPSPRGRSSAFLPDGATQRSPSPAFLGNRTNPQGSMRNAAAGTPKRTRGRKGIPGKA